MSGSSSQIKTLYISASLWYNYIIDEIKNKDVKGLRFY